MTTDASAGIAVLYVARGADADALHRMASFHSSYRRHPAGIDHSLHVLFKGFDDDVRLTQARSIFACSGAHELFLEDDAFDLGAYAAAAARVTSPTICCLNSASVILGDDWLLKLKVHLDQPDVGLVGCTASYEAPQHEGYANYPFPNPHLRTSAFLIDRLRFLAIVGAGPFTLKQHVYRIEHGPDNMTRQIEADGLRVLVVGRNGRGYSRGWWIRSGTFRQGMQENLLVGDNQTRGYATAPIARKRVLFQLAWGNGALGQIDDGP